ncbi:GTP-binding protein [Vallitaleaceae bacterium 9-2]
MTNIYLITGFLGAGKTTFLNRQLANCTRKTGVLINEFGKVSMDTIAMESHGIDVLELTNGSIFCACLKDRFIEGLIQLVQMDLDDIYIESSGLSDPSNMESVLKILEKKVQDVSYVYRGSICLVDGLYFFEELEKLANVERQIKHSHYIIINKADLISDKKIMDIKKALVAMNPHCIIEVADHGRCPMNPVKNLYYPIDEDETINTQDNRPKQLIMSFLKSPTREQLQEFLEEICVGFYRFKGYVRIDNQMFKVDGVNKRIDMVAIDEKAPGLNASNTLVFLASNGLESITLLLASAEKYIAGLYKIQV